MARCLRRRPSAGERWLWEILRDRRLGGLKFRRQAPIGPYVADFICYEHSLIVEVDGPLHDAVSDAVRDEWLTAKGYRVLRFAEAVTHKDRDSIAADIIAAVESRRR
jgi:very-short-patch-repair endonuclease